MIQYTFLESEFQTKSDMKLNVKALVMDQLGDNHLRIEHTLTCGTPTAEDCSHRQTLLHIRPQHTHDDCLVMRMEGIKTDF